MRIGTTGSVPFVTKSVAEDYPPRPTNYGGTVLKWTLAAHPRSGSVLPVQVLAPPARPIAEMAMRRPGTRI
ncbi:hypothetical protein [Nocardia sp. NPDC052566]|uniref:hypothetical protein n=1 Tax=Nocardia sp. NPDC052566 TaxID=3364330 RepID=UPI0037C7E9D4